MAPPADRVRPYKHEDASTGGQASQRRPWPKVLNPQQDGIDVAGVFFQEVGSNDEGVAIWREAGVLRFRDTTVGAGLSFTLSQLASGGGGGPPLSNLAPVAVSSTSSPGVSSEASRADHRHALLLGAGLAFDGFGRLYATGGGGGAQNAHTVFTLSAKHDAPIILVTDGYPHVEIPEGMGHHGWWRFQANLQGATFARLSATLLSSTGKYVGIVAEGSLDGGMTWQPLDGFGGSSFHGFGAPEIIAVQAGPSSEYNRIGGSEFLLSSGWQPIDGVFNRNDLWVRLAFVNPEQAPDFIEITTIKLEVGYWAEPPKPDEPMEFDPHPLDEK